MLNKWFDCLNGSAQYLLLNCSNYEIHEGSLQRDLLCVVEWYRTGSSWGEVVLFIELEEFGIEFHAKDVCVPVDMEHMS